MKISWPILILLLSSYSIVAQGTSEAPRRLCKKVSGIKQIPHERDEKGVDVVYDEIRSAGAALIPCLIDQITDTTITHDPRCPHITDETKIGDVSYFLLVDLLGIDFTQYFPDEVKAKFKTDGVYAYHEYIEKRGARAELQRKLRRHWHSAQRVKN